MDQVVFWKKLFHFFEKIVSVKLEVLGKVLRKVLMIGFYKWTSIFVTFCYSYFMHIPDIWLEGVQRRLSSLSRRKGWGIISNVTKSFASSLLCCIFAACHTLYSEFNLPFVSLLNVNVSYTQKCKTTRELDIYFVSKLSSLWGTLCHMQLNRGISMGQTVCILSTILWNHFILLLMLWRLTFCFEQ